MHAKLPEGTLVPGTPSADEILAAYGTGLDTFYVLASQYAHGAELATSNYRANFGDAADYGELGTAADWIQPLSQAWGAATKGMRRLMEVTDLPIPPALYQVDIQVEEALDELRNSLRRTMDSEF